MKITQKKSKQTLVIALSAVLLLAVASFVYIVPMDGSFFGWQLSPSNTEKRKVNDVNLDKPTKDELKTGNDTKEETVKSDQENKKLNEENPNHTTTVTISAANVYENTVQIRALISGITSNASCTLKLSQGASTKTYSADIQNLANSSTCQGFNIPTAELTPGKWAFSITVASPNKQLGVASGEVEV